MRLRLPDKHAENGQLEAIHPSTMLHAMVTLGCSNVYLIKVHWSSLTWAVPCIQFILPRQMGILNALRLILDQSYHGMPLPDSKRQRTNMSSEIAGGARSHGISPENLLINRPIHKSLMQWTWRVKPRQTLPRRYFYANTLQIAAGDGCNPLVELLLKRGASVNVVDNYGWTPLHFAACAGHVATIKMLLKFGGQSSPWRP